MSQGKSDTMLIENAIAQGAKKILLLSTDVAKSWKDFKGQFEFVQAAGGLVFNAKGEALFIYRLEKWDLPKGKVEENESITDGALREVEEECCITDLVLGDRICTTWHTYIQKGEPILKATEWFQMKYLGTIAPTPQLTEGITDARWIAMNDLSMVKSNTYPSVLDVIDAHRLNPN